MINTTTFDDDNIDTKTTDPKGHRYQKAVADVNLLNPAGSN